jgi:hypothetical protein
MNYTLSALYTYDFRSNEENVNESVKIYAMHTFPNLLICGDLRPKLLGNK